MVAVGSLLCADVSSGEYRILRICSEWRARGVGTNGRGEDGCGGIVE